MKNNAFKLLAGLVVLALAISACGGAATTAAPAATEAPTVAPATQAPTAAPAAKGKVCEVTDTGGVDDKGFNQIGWEGAQAGAKALGWDATYLESKQQTDYEKNINEFLGSKCDLIVTVGFLLGDATKAAATAHPEQKFQILDYAYDPAIDNVWAQVYATNEASFLAGYLAAGTTKSGKVGTFGGINIPPVADFMVGFQEGVDYYNKQKGAKVQVLGWDNAKKDGTFVGNFENKDDGKNAANALMDEGADVIFPVAGPVGLGAAAAIQQRGAGYYMIGVDTDQYVSTEYGKIMLSSVLKHLELSVQDAVQSTASSSFKGGTHVANLANGGVGLAPFHDFDSQVPQTLKDELAQATKDIIAGTIKVDSFATLGAAAVSSSKLGKICEVTDTGGVDDKGFNQIGWEGAQAAAKTLGGEATYLESKQQTDYEKNINEFLNSKCDLIVTVGFLLGDATKAAATAHPEQKFQILDYAYDPAIDNVWGQVYATNEASFLAGYLAAGTTKSGKVGTFGGINIPPVADFMVGFTEGVAYYNQQKGTKVEVLGWDNKKKDGTFVGNFENKDDGKNAANALMDEGADVIFPVAGPVGLGAAAAIQQRGAGYYMIGVDTDQYNSTEYGKIMLSSVLKHLELSVQEAAQAAADGSFKGGTHVANLANGGVGLAPFHDFDSQVPQTLKDELAQVQKDIISGKIVVDSFATLK